MLHNGLGRQSRVAVDTVVLVVDTVVLVVDIVVVVVVVLVVDTVVLEEDMAVQKVGQYKKEGLQPKITDHYSSDRPIIFIIPHRMEHRQQWWVGVVVVERQQQY